MSRTKWHLLSRRHFVGAIVHGLGARGAFGALACSLGLARRAQGHPSLARPALPTTQKQRIAVVGAGIAGLVCAYELHNAGYHVTVLEARARVGGRVWTLRGGDKVVQNGHPTQHVAFDSDHYFNAGAARIPTHHDTMLHYCRTLNVLLEPFNNTQRNHLARFPGAAGSSKIDEPVSMRQVGDNVRGQLAEWLQRSIQRGDLDNELSMGDRSLVAAYLTAYGDLDQQGRYRGARARGQDRLFFEPALLDEVRTRLPPSRVFDAALWDAVRRDMAGDGTPMMLQPVGGMDRLPKAFHKHLGDIVRLGTAVDAISQTACGVQVRYIDRSSGSTQYLHADHLVLTVPLGVIRNIAHDFSGDIASAIAGSEVAHAQKVAWQSPRFWETEERIFGGVSYAAHPFGRLMYPNDTLGAEQGVLVAGYVSGADAPLMSAFDLHDFHASSRALVDMLHPGGQRHLRHPVAVAWHRVPFSEAAWRRNDISVREWRSLSEGSGRIHFAGDAVNPNASGSWQNVAALSGLRAVEKIFARSGGA